MKSSKKIKFIGLAFFLCVAQTGLAEQITIVEKIDNGLFSPQNPPSVRYQDSDISILPIYSDKQIYLEIVKKGFAAISVALPPELAQLTEVRPAYANRIVAIGLANSTVSVITVIDKREGVVIDSFWGYKPVISPDGRWIAFQEFFPAHFSDVIESSFRIYDISIGAKENRHGKHLISEKQFVGTVVYPLSSTAAEMKSGNSNRSIDHVLHSTFHWWPNSKQYTFAINEGKALNLLVVKLQVHGEGWDTFLYNLNSDGAACENTCELSRIKSLVLENDNIDLVVFPGNLGAKDLRLKLSTGQFKQINR